MTWRDHLTDDERAEVAALEQRAAEVDAERRRITAALRRIQTRVNVRLHRQRGKP